MNSPSGGARRIADLPTTELAGHEVAVCDRATVLDAVFAELDRGCGGWLMTLNVDLAYQGHSDGGIRALQRRASVIVADGMPLVWAARIRGTRIAERIAGSDLVFQLAERCAREGRRLYLLGGAAGAAERSAQELRRISPGLELAGISDPVIDPEPDPAQLTAVAEALREADPDVVLVAFGSPKTERLIDALREQFPAVWWVGVGIGLGFAAGQVKRAPVWMRRIGAEWLHRLAKEPGRLARRYLLHDLPFALRLLGSALRERIARR